MSERFQTNTMIVGACITTLMVLIIFLATMNSQRLWDINERLIRIEEKFDARTAQE